MENDPLAFLGGRKFIMAIFCLAMVFVLTCMLIVPVDKFLALVEYLFSAYILGNVATKITSIFNK